MSEENWRDNVRGISSFTCSRCKEVVGTYLGYRKHLVECEKVTTNKEVEDNQMGSCFGLKLDSDYKYTTKEVDEDNWKQGMNNALKCLFCGYIPSSYDDATKHIDTCPGINTPQVDDNQLDLDLKERVEEEKDKIDRVDLTRDIQDYRDKLESEFMENTPSVYHTSYYKLDKEDLYSIFIKKFGFQAWLRHVEMESIQYLWRAKDKGVYKEDINKVKVICERILAELKENS